MISKPSLFQILLIEQKLKRKMSFRTQKVFSIVINNITADHEWV